MAGCSYKLSRNSVY